MGNLLFKASDAVGIKIFINKPVTEIEKESDGFLIKTEFKSKTGSRVQNSKADMVVHGTGRVPDIEDLRLEKAGVKIENGAIAVNKYTQTLDPFIYAGGDCVSEDMQLMPVVVHQGQVAAANILKEGSSITNYTGIPRAVSKISVLASVSINSPDNTNPDNNI